MDEHGRQVLKEANEAGDVKSRKSLWESRIHEIEESDKANPFSRNFTGEHEKLDKDHYGRPPEGSLTEKRGQEAAVWVDKEIDKLIVEIKKIGEFDAEEGGITVEFGKLFLQYQDISNTVVGILMRAKKRGRVKYEGEMLYQHKPHVKITVIE